MTSVTVPGPGNSTITQTFSNEFNLALAQNIAAALAAASAAGSLDIQTTDGSSALPPVAPGKIGELVIEPGTATTTIPASAGYSFVVDLASGDTIFGSPALSIMGGSGNSHTIVDPAIITLGDGTNVVTVSGAGDNVAVGNGLDTLTGIGSGTISGGTGTDDFILQGSYVVNSQGKNDTISAGDGAVTVNALAAGVGALAITGDGKFTGHIAGTSDTVLGSSGFGATFVTLSGSSDVVVGGQAVLSVLDSGTSNTITAGAGSASVTAAGGSFVNGGSGDLTFVGGAGASTIIGSSGDLTVFGGTGATSLFGGAGGTFTYVNTTPGGLFYTGGPGGETLDASLSKGSALILAGQDTAGQSSLVGGVGNDALVAGGGSTTLVGGGGADFFDFYSQLGGAASQNVIGDFSAIDNVMLVNYAPGEAAAAIAGATVSGSSTTITLSDHTTITFTGVTNAGALIGHIQQANS